MSETNLEESSEATLSALLGGVLAYSTTGHNRPCGQAIGADGCGDYAVLLYGTPEQAEQKARLIIRDLEKNGYKLSAVVFVQNGEFGYGGRNHVTFTAP